MTTILPVITQKTGGYVVPKTIFYSLLLLILSLFSTAIYAQSINETEPNDHPGDFGTKSISPTTTITGTVFEGKFDFATFLFTPANNDYWNIQDATSGEFVVSYGGMIMVSLITYSDSNRNTATGNGVVSAGSTITLSADKYYSLHISSTAMGFMGMNYSYSVTITRSTTNEVKVTGIAPTKVCKGVESTFNLEFTVDGTFENDNKFVFLTSSDPEFANETNVLETSANGGPASFSATYSTPGQMYLRVKSTNPAVTSNTVSFTVNEDPAVNAGNDISICTGSSVKLEASGASSYTWGGNLGNESIITVTPSEKTTYFVTGTDETGCSATDSVIVSVTNLEKKVTPLSGTVGCTGPAYITVKSSGEGVSYTLRNDENDEQVGATQQGDGKDLLFNIGDLTGKTTFNILAEQPSKALYFETIGNKVVIPSYTGINTQFSENAITIEGWFKPSGSSTALLVGQMPENRYSAKSKDNAGSENTKTLIDEATFVLYQDGGNVHGGFQYDGELVALSAELSLNTWQHIAFTYDGSWLKLYVNGTEAATLNHKASLAPTDKDWYLGEQLMGPSSPFSGNSDKTAEDPYEKDSETNPYYSGSMDEVRLWNKALTSSEIGSGMSACPDPAASGLVAHYTFNDIVSGQLPGLKDGGEATLTDATGNGYDGQLYGFNQSTMLTTGQNVCACSQELSAKPVFNLGAGAEDKFPTASLATLCNSGSTTIILNSSQVGFDYYLRNNADNTIVDGPLKGNGGKLLFNSGTLYNTTTFNVYAENTENTLCSKQMSKTATVTVNYSPKWIEAGEVYVCPGTKATLTASAPEGSIIQWFTQASGGEPLSTGTTLTTPVLNAQASYYVQATENGCSTKRTEAVANVYTVTDPFPGTLDGVCVDAGSVILPLSTSTEKSLNSMTWSGTGVTDNIFYPEIAGPGTHTLKLVYTDSKNNCTDSSGKSITVYDLPRVELSDFDEVCANMPIFSLSGGSPAGGDYSGEGVVDGMFTPGNGAGTYTITYTYTDDKGCTNSVNSSLKVNGLPTPAVTASAKSICQGTSALLNTGTYSEYQWFNGEQLIEGATGKSYNISQAGSYVVAVKDENGCAGSSSAVIITVNSLPAPNISFSGSPNFCINSSLTLDAGEFSTYQWKRDGTTIIGANAREYSAAVAGSYTVEVTDENKCSGVSLPVSVSGSGGVAVSTNGNTRLCRNASVTLTSSPASKYQWYKDGTAIDGATSSSYTTSEAGGYSVKATDVSGCTSTSNKTEITITELPEPSIINGSSANVCNGSSVKLSTQPIYAAYQWYRNGNRMNGGVYSTMNTFLGGDFAVTVTDVDGCTGTSATTTITVRNPAVSIVPSDKQIVCENEPLSVTATPGYRYQWFYNDQPVPGATSATLSAVNQGNYKVVVLDEFNCPGISSTLILGHKEAPVKPVLSLSGAMLSSSSPVNNQWYRNNAPIAGATGQTYLVEENGSFFVEVSNENGCNERSDAINITNVSVIENQAQSVMQAYPNPFGNQLIIEVSHKGAYELFDVTGRLALSGALASGNNIVATEYLATGTYQLNIHDHITGERRVVRLMK